MARERGSAYKDKIAKLTRGVFDTLTDVCLFVVFFHLQSYQVGSGRKSIGKAISQAVHLTRIVNAHNLERLIYRLKTKGYFEKKKDYLKITKLGKERLARVIPQYEKERPWDGRLYLITYDVPEEKRKERNYLRDFLKRLGCGRLQQSVWLTPYNPKEAIVDFIKERKLVGLVLVTELKEGSAIGGKDILTVVEKIYQLNKINKQYQEFVQKVREKKLKGFQLTTTYLSILKDDPQLPFELLPDDWWGERAYRLFKKEIAKIRRDRERKGKVKERELRKNKIREN